MRVIVALFLALLLPSAAAQAQLPKPDFNFEISDLPGEAVTEGFNLTIDVTLTCKMQNPDPTLNYEIEFDAVDLMENVLVLMPVAVDIENACFDKMQYEWKSEMWVDWTPALMAQTSEEIIEIGLVGTVESQGMPFHSAPDDYSISIDFMVANATMAEEQPLDESGDPIPPQETTPGFAVPLFVASLLVAGRRKIK